MLRHVTAAIDLTLGDGAASLAFMVALARVPGLRIAEELTIRVGDEEVLPEEIPTAHHGVIHALEIAPELSGTPLSLRYRATVESTWDEIDAAHDDEDGTEIIGEAGGPVDLLMYLRPSRYAEADRLLGMANAEFPGLRGEDLVLAVGQWVGDYLDYSPGFSRVTDGAVECLLARQGVCRDFAHVVVAMLRALDVPARVAAVYAPGLEPMDFHAVAEAWVDGAWHVVDGTRLAPRQALARIATGRDAADTAFLTSHGARLRLDSLNVTAVSEPYLPKDAHGHLLRMP